MKGSMGVVINTIGMSPLNEEVFLFLTQTELFFEGDRMKDSHWIIG